MGAGRVSRSKEEYILLVSQAVVDAESWETFRSRNFDSSASPVTVSFLFNQYCQTLEAAVEFSLTEAISERLLRGDADFIKAMRAVSSVLCAVSFLDAEESIELCTEVRHGLFQANAAGITSLRRDS